MMAAPRVVVVVQARMSSSRLPGKVLRPLAGAPALERLIERLSVVDNAAQRVIATSDQESDDVVATLCADRGFACVRGSLNDVLARYHQAARETKADVVVRVTGDCPLIDPGVVSRCVALYLREREHVDYASNADERTFPDGLDVEVFGFGALDDAMRSARSDYEREHVTPWITRHRRKISLVQETDLSDLRWTLDYAEDYEVITEIYDALFDPQRIFTTADVYRLLLQRPALIRTTRRRELHGAEREKLMGLIALQLAAKDSEVSDQ